MNELVLPFLFIKRVKLFDGINCKFISSCIILYSAWYMNYDSQLLKFQATLFFFSFSMLLLVIVETYFNFYWLGMHRIASFLLISHWGHRKRQLTED